MLRRAHAFYIYWNGGADIIKMFSWENLVTTMPFLGPRYSESKVVEFSNLEGYRGSSFTESLLSVSLWNGENDDHLIFFLFAQMTELVTRGRV